MSILATIRAALEAVPLIVKEIQSLRDAVQSIRDARAERELSDIKERLNKLTHEIKTTRGKDEMARIVRDLNRI